MRAVVFWAAIGLSFLASVAAEEPHLDRQRPEVPRYEAYWLHGGPDSKAGYLKLLVTAGSLADLAPGRFGPLGPDARPLALDHPALLFTTYRKDSLWDDPFHCVAEIDKLKPEGKTVEVEGIVYTYEPCPLEDVIRLLEHPLGQERPIHRRVHPLQNAQRTARAYVQLLKASQTASRQVPATESDASPDKAP